MRFIGAPLLAALLLALAPDLLLAKTEARLALASETARPGETVMAGVYLQLTPGWHTYWRYGGDAGTPAELQWTLPPGITAGEIAWPTPEKRFDDDLVSYFYPEEVLLLVPLKLDASNAPGPVEITIKVDWLECDRQCVPGKATVKASLVIGDQNKPSPDAALIETWQKRLPESAAATNIKTWWENTPTNDIRSVFIEGPAFSSSLAPTGGEGRGEGALSNSADFYPYPVKGAEISGITKVIPSDNGRIRLQKWVKRTEPQWPERIQGIFVTPAEPAKGRKSYEAEILFAPASASNTNTAAASVPGSTVANGQKKVTLWAALQLAFIGGLILNLMPCVLPVLSLKILGFVNQGGQSRRRVRLLGLTYGLGVLASFLVLAGGVIAVQKAGQLAGWGMQFQSPIFVVGVMSLVLLVALNLFGIFEVNLGGNTLDAASTLASKEGMGGAFFNGILAVLLATPCTAPFLGAALGYAFAQPPLTIILIFSVVAAGLAFPYVLLSFFPSWLGFLPKPGAWMQRFKIAMGFPMLATAMWLFTVAQVHYGDKIVWLGFYLILIAAAAWVYGEFYQRSAKPSKAGWIVALVLIAAGYGFALEHELDWRHPVGNSGSRIQNAEGGIGWQPWSPQAVAQARATGRPVFVDFTADWCLTCQANKKTSIEIPAVRDRLKALQAITLLGDYTRKDDAITIELNKYNRAGVPLVLVYPRDPKASPIILPELLTPNIVLEALEKAGR